LGRRVFPPICEPVLAPIDAYGCVGLRELLRWTESENTHFLEAVAAINKLSPGVGGCDAGRYDQLEPLQRKLVHLTSGNELTWIELTYFARREELKLDAVIELAKSLADFGVLLPDLRESLPQALT